jgi:hypothetical protein
MATEHGTTARPGWLFGPLPDLMLGCGGLYLCVLVVLSVGGAPLRASEALWLGPLLVLLIGAPHYGATLLRVYEHAKDRRTYAFFSLWVTLVIVACFGVSLFSATAATAMVTLYLSWSPWHYTGQNYGIAVMFLRRRGQPLDPISKRWLYSSFLCSFILTVLIFHGEGSAPKPEFASGPRELFAPLGIPSAVVDVLFPLCLAGVILGTGVAAARMLRAGATWTGLAPAGAMVGLQTVWFSIPFVARHFGIFGQVDALQWGQREYFFFWIALGHSAQYLWITAYTAREAERWQDYTGQLRYLGKILLAGTAVWTLPGILLDPHQLGQMWPQLTALSLLVASAVNLHHFVLDGAIWKLREGPIADLLIRRSAVAEPIGPSGGWPRQLVWGVAALGCALAFLRYAHEEVLFPRAVANKDFAAAQRVLDRMSWIVQVNPDARAQLERQQVMYRASRRAYDRRLEQRLGIGPNAREHLARAERALEAKDWTAALEHAEAGLAVDPENGALLRAAGQASIELGGAANAREYLEQAGALEPWNERNRELLERIPGGSGG